MSTKDSESPVTHEKRAIKQEDCFEALPFCLPARQKWLILSVIFVVQLSMNFNTSVYANAIPSMVAEYEVSEIFIRGGQAGCLLAYGFGSEMWAPWSEDFGRWWILQASLLLVNACNVWSCLATTGASMVASRVLLGLSSAGGSVTLGMVADMWRTDEQQYAVAFVVFSSVAGSALGPIVGGFIQDYYPWRWVFLVQLFFGLATQLLHLLFTTETRASIMMGRIARRRRKAALNGDGPTNDTNLYGPNCMRSGHRLPPAEFAKLFIRPFHMFLTEPIVLLLSLLSGFSDALIFTFLEGFTPVFQQWSFSPSHTGMCFLSIILGYVLAYLAFIPFIRHDMALARRNPAALTPERRLFFLLWAAPLEAVGLLGFAWTGIGPPMPWFVPLVFSTLVGIANYAIYMATIDYMVASYGPYAASATGGNALARDVLAGIATYYAGPLYHMRWIGENGNEWLRLACASTILAGLAGLVIIPVYVFYRKGREIRARSPFAKSLVEDGMGFAGDSEGRGGGD